MLPLHKLLGNTNWCDDEEVGKADHSSHLGYLLGWVGLTAGAVVQPHSLLGDRNAGFSGRAGNNPEKELGIIKEEKCIKGS